MNYKRVLRVKGANLWYLAAAVILNIFWTTSVATLISIFVIRQDGGSIETGQIALLAAAFFGPFLIAWSVGSMAGDRRAPTYGIYGSLGGVAVLLITALPSGLLGIMMIVVAISGGINGGLFSLQRQMRA